MNGTQIRLHVRYQGRNCFDWFVKSGKNTSTEAKSGHQELKNFERNVVLEKIIFFKRKLVFRADIFSKRRLLLAIRKNQRGRSAKVANLVEIETLKRKIESSVVVFLGVIIFWLLIKARERTAGTSIHMSL